MLSTLNAIGKIRAGLVHILPVIGMLTCAGAALADDAVPLIGADDQITVTGTTKKDVANFVGALTATRYRDRLTRFETPICPRVAGRPESESAAIAERMRRVAEAAGVPIASGECKANILVLIAPDKAALIQAFAKKYPYFMRDLPKSKRKAMLKSDSPAAVWHFNGALIGADGREITELLDDFLINRSTERASTITDPVHQQFRGAVVVLESAETSWLSTKQLADYALLRVLLNADPENLPNAELPTILSILDAKPGEEVPTSLTQWDLEAIRAYYTVNRVLPVSQQRDQISSQMLKKLAVAADAPK